MADRLITTPHITWEFSLTSYNASEVKRSPKTWNSMLLKVPRLRSFIPLIRVVLALWSLVHTSPSSTSKLCTSSKQRTISLHNINRTSALTARYELNRYNTIQDNFGNLKVVPSVACLWTFSRHGGPGSTPGPAHERFVKELAMEKNFSPSTSLFPCQYHSANASYSSSSTRCSYQKDRRSKPGSIPKSNVLWEIGEHPIGKNLDSFPTRNSLRTKRVCVI